MKMAPLFSEGPPASKIARLALWLGAVAALLVEMFAVGHVLRRVSAITWLICMLGCFLEYLRVRGKDDAKIEPVDLKEPSR